MDVLRVDLVVGGYVDLGRLRDGHDVVHPAGHPALHLGEGIPAPHGERLPQGAGVGDLQAPVHGDRVVNRGEHRETDPLLEQYQSPAQALVVVDQVEVVTPVAEVVPGPEAEGQRFGEGAGVERGHLNEIPAGFQLPDPSLAHRIVVVVEVQAGEGHQRHPFIEDRVRLARKHLHRVA